MPLLQEKQTILVAEDDFEDRMFIQRALKECKWLGNLIFASDGEALMAQLLSLEEPEDASGYPGLILVDLKMPKKDGRQVLKEIKADKKLQTIPVVVLTTSNSQDNVRSCYMLGASSYIVKPSQFHAWTELMSVLVEYWFDIALLPGKGKERIDPYR